MKYAKMTFSYINQNKLMTIIYTLLPALLYAFFVKPCSIIEYSLKELNDTHTFGQIMKFINDMSSVARFIVFPIMFVVTVVMLSGMIGSMQKKMRFGKIFSDYSKTFFTRVNNDFFAVFKTFLFLCGVNILFGFVMSSFIFFFIQIASANAFWIIPVVYCILFLLLIVALTWVMLCLPIMTMKGFGFLRSIKESLRIVGQDFVKFFVGYIIPMAISVVPVLLISIFDFNGQKFWAIIINFIFYVWTFVYTITYMYVSYYELEQIEREDLKQNYYGE